MQRILFLCTFLAVSLLFVQAQAQCSISGPTTLTPNQTTTYVASFQGGASYFWSTTGGLTITGSNTGSSVTVTGNSTGSVCYTRFRAGAEPCSICQTVNVVANPTCPNSLNIFSFIEECLVTEAVINLIAVPNPTPTAGVTTYRWTVVRGPGSILGNIIGTSTTMLVPTNSTTDVRLTATCNGNTVSTIRTIRTGSCNALPFGQAVVFPNPVNNLMKVQVKDQSPSSSYSIEIIDRQGKTVISKALKGTGEQLDLSNLQKGVYFVRTRQNGKLLNTKRLVKQ